MKKFFSLVAIAAVAATMFTSCKDDDPTPPPPTGKAKLTLSVDKKTIAKDAEGTFTVTSDINAPEAIVVSVSSSSAATLTVDPASVTIAKGTKTITGKFKGVADGKATITIAASGVTLTVPSVEITVGESTELETLLVCDADNAWSNEFFGPEGSFGFTFWFNSPAVLLENGGADYYGTDLELKAVDKGTDIAGLTLTQNLEHVNMGLNTGEGFDKLPNFVKIGAAQYVVFSIVETAMEASYNEDGSTLLNPEDFTHDKPQLKGWALVSSENDGTTVTLHAFKFPATKVGE